MYSAKNGRSWMIPFKKFGIVKKNGPFIVIYICIYIFSVFYPNMKSCIIYII